ncbi:DUF6174 domain-containing protein [Patulibacter sp.]|uniref:DUF6174 domain-containing protein n=1 Tax=Patulibacter sp. TaxID=1912859 RepID=UPI00272550B6|nr:DUF6174 domain-containing protein [Patulibacter sp.]MDO9409752.1 DUF6174 domain-containing protein [Patulibacter sp.]
MRALPRSRPVRLVLAVVLVLAAAVAGSNGYVLGRGTGATDDVAGVRHAQTAIVLGALVQPDGRMSGMLRDRVDRAVGLWRAGKVDRILVSGDHLRWGYDEPTTMRVALQRAGVPARAIFTDHAGVDTRATMVRAREVFDVDSAVVVTQGFHMGRALYLARAAGLRAQGVTSDLHPYGAQGRRSTLREVLARAKSVAAQVTGARVLLGPEHPITGDGRTTWGPSGPPVATGAARPLVLRPALAPAAEPDGPDPSIADGRAQRALDAARERWAARGLRSYRMRPALSCFCPPEVRAPRTVQVRRGRPVGAVPDALRRFATVPRLFARVQEAIDAGVASLTVSYASGTGRPTSLSVDRSRAIADEETVVTVDRFRIAR